MIKFLATLGLFGSAFALAKKRRNPTTTRSAGPTIPSSAPSIISMSSRVVHSEVAASRSSTLSKWL